MKASKFLLYLKGMAMGSIDVVPGVSGSTVAVILCIYERFIAALKGIDLELLRAFARLFRLFFSASARRDFKALWQAKDLSWLCILLLGLATAFILASQIIPLLMERYAQQMRALFFGLVLASVITPWRELKAPSWREGLCILGFAVLTFFLLGQSFQAPYQLIAVEASGQESISSLLQTKASLLTPSETLALAENQALQTLDPLAPLPAGSRLFLAQPPFYYVFLGGFIAISAMLLPGISGSFALLIMGLYYFMLNTTKHLLLGLGMGQFYGQHLAYLGILALGVIVGIASFSRALTWLFRKHKNMTLAAIIGILLGCLRGIWPFRSQDNTTPAGLNIWPSLDSEGLFLSLALLLLGLTLVVLSLQAQRHFERKTRASSPTSALQDPPELSNDSEKAAPK